MVKAVLSGDGDEVEKEEERLQVRNYFNRGRVASDARSRW